MNYSKTKYVQFKRCPKLLWLENYRPEEKVDESGAQQKNNGNIIGDLAMNLFGSFYLVETEDNDISKMIKNTNEALNKGYNVICEAAFSYNNNYCAVDILKNNHDGTYSIYEVKSSTYIKSSYYDDLAYQNYVLTNLNIKVKNTFIVFINNEYIYDGNFNIHDFFKIVDLTEDIKAKYHEVEDTLKEADIVMNNKNEPDARYIHKICKKDSEFCPFINSCRKYWGFPENKCVLDLNDNRQIDKQLEQGIVSFDDIINNNIELDRFKKAQIYVYKNNIDNVYIEKEKVLEFLNSIKGKKYFFDFEAFQVLVPNIIGTHPYESIPFQYSLHILDENDKLEVRNFLGDGINDPRRALVQQMINDLGTEGPIIAFNMTYEKTTISNLIKEFPEYEKELKNIHDRFYDLEVPFSNGWCYQKDMKNRSSIKLVLPALFPDDPELNYKNLDQVHNGTEAPEIYLKLKDMNDEERLSTRKNLLSYCNLDTYAMVKIYQKLKELCK